MNSTSHWITIFSKTTLPSGPINTVKEALEDEQVKHLGLEQTLTHPESGNFKVIGPAVGFSGSSVHCRTAPPLLGEHTREILSSVLDYDEEEISQLRARGVVHTT